MGAGFGPYTEPRAKDGWFEEVGPKTVELAGEFVARFSAASGMLAGYVPAAQPLYYRQ
jgi:hypothetical protein